MKRSVLFICVHNSARSQMAEALLNHFCPHHFVAESAGLEEGTLNPYAVRVMAEIGIDISAKSTRRAFDVVKSGKVFAHAISLCEEASEGRCPVLPRHGFRHHWEFPNPASDEGGDDERLERMRHVRNLISRKIQTWCDEQCGLATG